VAAEIRLVPHHDYGAAVNPDGRSAAAEALQCGDVVTSAVTLFLTLIIDVLVKADAVSTAISAKLRRGIRLWR
jgi:hypothetical protein